MRSAARRSLRVLAGLGTLAFGLLLLASAGTSISRAASSGNTTANVQVNSVITLSSLTSSFTLTGDPGATKSQNGAATMKVFTNNLTGYVVTVQAGAATLSAATPGNTDSIPIASLQVRETGGVAFVSLSNVAAVPVHTQLTPSAIGGDNLSNDYQVVIPSVAADTYSVVLTYVATAL
jgi:hypothetical protein